MMRTAKFAILSLIAIALSLPVGFDAGAAQVNTGEGAPFTVVVFRSSNIFAPAAIAQDEAMRKALVSKTSRTVQFFVEVVDTLDFHGVEIGAEYLSLFRRKYNDQQIDLFMAVGADALRFVQRHREQLLPAVPVLFYNVAEDAVGRDPLPRDFTGVYLKFDVAGTLNLAMRLQPEARRIVVVAGASPYDKNWLRRAREAVAASKVKIEVVYLTDLALPQILEKLKGLPRDAIVLYLSVVRDVTGRIYQSRDVAQQVSDASSAPVYVVMNHYLEQGVVGGAMPSFELHGKTAGETAARLLAGEKADAIAPQISLTVPTVDWRQLQRWGLSEKRLPNGTAVEFRQPTFWQRHHQVIMIAAAVGLAQFLLIAALLFHRAKRLRSERALEDQLKFERLVAEISASFINAAVPLVDGNVERALEQVCVFMDIDRCHVFECLPNSKTLVLTHHSRPGDGQASASLDDAPLLPWLVGQLTQGRTVALEEVARDLPPEANEERAHAAHNGIKSMLTIPLRINAEMVHGIGFQTTRRFQPWPSDLVSRLHLIGEIVVSALSSRRSEQALRVSEERYRTVVEEQTELVCRFRPDATLTFVNAAYADYFAVSREELIGRSFLTLLPEADRRQALAHIESLAQSKQVGSQEHQVVNHKGELRWQNWVNCPILDSSGQVVEFQSVGRDVTDSKLVEENLRESQYRYAMAAEAGAVMVWDLDLATKAVRIDPAPSPGATRLSHAKWLQVIHPEDRDRVLEEQRRALETIAQANSQGQGPLPEMTYRVFDRDGRIRWILVRGIALTTAQGRPHRLLGTATDITERKLAEDALHQALAEVQRLKELLEAENTYLRAEVSETHLRRDIVGSSAAIKKTLQSVEQVAPTNMTVLILGETGTGKELVARAVHERSTRRSRPLVKVNCAALPANLIESELFGHEKGSFTGALTRQLGRFELASGGTIFLDEIGDLPLSLQTKLLRVLQEGELERLGSGKTIKVDVRVIAATNRDLEEALRTGTFRHDLYYRLNVYPIRVPPLRERKDDIAVLAATFLADANIRLGQGSPEVRDSILDTLRRYDWPGNIRELQNVIERAAVLSRGQILELPEDWGGPPISGWIAAKRIGMMFDAPSPNEPTLEELERGHILEILQQTGWRIEGPKGAAAILGLHPSTLRSRMLRLGLKKTRKAAEPDELLR